MKRRAAIAAVGMVVLTWCTLLLMRDQHTYACVLAACTATAGRWG